MKPRKNSKSKKNKQLPKEEQERRKKRSDWADSIVERVIKGMNHYNKIGKFPPVT